MPDLPLTIGNYGRSRVNLPQERLVNAYVEKSPGGPSGEIRTTRPGEAHLTSVIILIWS